MQNCSNKKIPAELLGRLDRRHDDLLRRLDELNEQVESALEEIAEGKPGSDTDG